MNEAERLKRDESFDKEWQDCLNQKLPWPDKVTWNRAWKAALESKADAKRVCYGIFASNGEMFWEEHCIADSAEDLEGWLDELQADQPERGWEIRGMAALPPPPAGKEEA